MAAGLLQKPGTKYGPCKNPCKHLDCAATKRMATMICRFCEKQIGYMTPFYEEHKDSLVHSICLEDAHEVS